MEIDKLLVPLIQHGGVAGMIVFGAVIVLGMILRAKTSAGGKPPPRTETEELAKISTKLTNIDRRVTDIEHDLKNRPTRDEFHEITLILAKHNGRFDLIETITKGTGAAVARLEDHLLDIDKRAQRGK